MNSWFQQVPHNGNPQKLAWGLRVGEPAFAAWPTPRLPLATLPGVPGDVRASVGTDEMVNIISRGHWAFLTGHRVVN